MSLIAIKESCNGPGIKPKCRGDQPPHVQIAEMMILPVNRY